MLRFRIDTQLHGLVRNCGQAVVVALGPAIFNAHIVRVDVNMLLLLPMTKPREYVALPLGCCQWQNDHFAERSYRRNNGQEFATPEMNRRPTRGEGDLADLTRVAAGPPLSIPSVLSYRWTTMLLQNRFG